MSAVAPNVVPSDPTPPVVQPELDLAGARRRFEKFLRWTVTEELPACASFLPESERAPFAAENRHLPAPGDAERIEVWVRARRRGAAGWAAGWIAERVWALSCRGMTPRVLDAGCGFGSDALLFAAMGAEVVGVDLDGLRLGAAERRARYHASVSGRAPGARFEHGDVCAAWPRGYDVVWVRDGLAAFASLEGFLAETRRKLRPGGVVIVDDANGAHPAHRAAAAAGRAFTPAGLRERFAAHGFAVTHHELPWPDAPGVPDGLYGVLGRFRGPAGWASGLAPRQVFVAGAR